MPTKNLGQFFTTDKTLQNKVCEFIKNNPTTILEPSVGRGDLVHSIINNNNNNNNNCTNPNKKIKFDMYEIDRTIKKFLVNKADITFGDFLKIDIHKKYTTIVGNPPYVRTNTGNLYIDFIEKCVHLLTDGGELIFIIPSDFFKITSTEKLLSYMYKHGSFTHIYRPNNGYLFDDANVDVVIFRYCNGCHGSKVEYNGKTMWTSMVRGTILFTNEKPNDTKDQEMIIGDYFDVYVGLVSALDSVFNNDEFGNITVLCDKDKYKKFIFLESYPTKDKRLNKYMLNHKDELLARRVKYFDEDNWWEWGGPRNIGVMRAQFGKKCIYVRNLTRKGEIAFEGFVEYFGAQLIMLVPKDGVCDDGCMQRAIAKFNSDAFKENYTYDSRFKIGHRQIYNTAF